MIEDDIADFNRPISPDHIEAIQEGVIPPQRRSIRTVTSRDSKSESKAEISVNKGDTILSPAPVIQAEEQGEVSKATKKTKIPTVSSLKDVAKDDSDFASEDSDIEEKCFSPGLRFSDETGPAAPINPTPLKKQVTTHDNEHETEEKEGRAAGVERITRVLKRVNTMNMRSTLMAKCSNKPNHDYLFLRKRDNLRFYKQAHKILSQNREQGEQCIFSELVQKYDATFRTKEFIIVITSGRLYLLDTKCHLKYRQELADCTQIIKVKANPSFFALVFSQGPPLILETFRRIELIMYILS